MSIVALEETKFDYTISCPVLTASGIWIMEYSVTSASISQNDLQFEDWTRGNQCAAISLCFNVYCKANNRPPQEAATLDTIIK